MSKGANATIKERDAAVPAFIVVRHGEDEKTILNADCRVVMLLDAIKDRCRLDREAEVDLVDEKGKLMAVGDSMNRYVYEVLEDRSTFIALAIEKENGEDEESKKFVPLLSAKTMQVEYPTIYANLETLSKNKGKNGKGQKGRKGVTRRNSRLK